MTENSISSLVVNHRYEHLKECISDYLGDEGEDSSVLIEDIKRACSDLKSYHTDRLKHYTLVQEAFLR